MTKAASTAVEFTQKCLVVHRHIPINDGIALTFWAEYCHNLAWLIEDCSRGSPAAVEWYKNMPYHGAQRVQVGTNGITAEDIARSTEALDSAVKFVFKNTDGIRGYLRHIEQALKEPVPG